MKKLIALTLLLTLGTPAIAGYSQPGGVKDRTCYKEVYREEYVPGTRDNPGRVRRWTETREVPCKGNRGGRRNRPRPQNNPSADDNSCIEGAIIGGIAGGGAGAALSRGDGRWWAIPLGVVGGTMVGCQIDGG